jgi:bacterial/archaeal transporter family protein
MQAILFAVLAGLCWGVGEIFSKKALNTGMVGPMTVLLVRTLTTLPLAAIAYAVSMSVWKWERPNWTSNATPQVWLMLTLGSGLLAGFAGVFFFYMGLASPGGDISRIRPIAFALSPATAVVLGWIMLGEPMSLRKLISCTLIIIGIVLLTGESHGGSPAPSPAAETRS